MLAHKWNAEMHQSHDFLISEKLDGMRALLDGTQLVLILSTHHIFLLMDFQMILH
jgi:hypothetical protein